MIRLDYGVWIRLFSNLDNFAVVIRKKNPHSYEVHTDMWESGCAVSPFPCTQGRRMAPNEIWIPASVNMFPFISKETTLQIWLSCGSWNEEIVLDNHGGSNITPRVSYKEAGEWDTEEERKGQKQNTERQHHRLQRRRGHKPGNAGRLQKPGEQWQPVKAREGRDRFSLGPPENTDFRRPILDLWSSRAIR